MLLKYFEISIETPAINFYFYFASILIKLFSELKWSDVSERVIWLFNGSYKH